MAFLEWLQGTWVGVLVAESLWGYPLFETIHSLGMAMRTDSIRANSNPALMSLPAA